MPQLFPPEIIENTVECYHARISTRSKAIYGLILVMILLVFASLPLVQVDISSQSRGVIRSPYENTTIQSALYGEVVSYRLLENKAVQKGDTLIILNSDKLNEQVALANRKMQENDLFISDIACLLSAKYNQLLTPKYRGEYYRYRAKLNEQQISVNYLRKELATQKSLAEQKVISNFDYLQSKNNYEKANEQLKALEQDYQSNWVAEQTTLNQQNNELASSIKQVEKEKQQYVILALVERRLFGVVRHSVFRYVAAKSKALALHIKNGIWKARAFLLTLT